MATSDTKPMPLPVQRDLAHDDAMKRDPEAKRTERVRVVLREEEIPY